MRAASCRKDIGLLPQHTCLYAVPVVPCGYHGEICRMKIHELLSHDQLWQWQQAKNKLNIKTACAGSRDTEGVSAYPKLLIHPASAARLCQNSASQGTGRSGRSSADIPAPPCSHTAGKPVML